MSHLPTFDAVRARQEELRLFTYVLGSRRAVLSLIPKLSPAQQAVRSSNKSCGRVVPLAGGGPCFRLLSPCIGHKATQALSLEGVGVAPFLCDPRASFGPCSFRNACPLCAPRILVTRASGLHSRYYVYTLVVQYVGVLLERGARLCVGKKSLLVCVYGRRRRRSRTRR